MTKLYTIGIDPGKNGGAVVLDEDGRCVTQQRLAVTVHASADPVGVAVAKAARQLVAQLPTDGDVRVIARVETQWVGGREGGGGAQVREEGAWLAALELLGCEVGRVEASYWRSMSGTMRGSRPANKAASIAYVKGRLPTVNLKPGRCRVEQDGIADAAVIAHVALLVAKREGS